jgi:hypothetical protein
MLAHGLDLYLKVNPERAGLPYKRTCVYKKLLSKGFFKIFLRSQFFELWHEFRKTTHSTLRDEEVTRISQKIKPLVTDRYQHFFCILTSM